MFMQKILSAIAIANFIIFLLLLGGSGYVISQKNKIIETLIEEVKDKLSIPSPNLPEFTGPVKKNFSLIND